MESFRKLGIIEPILKSIKEQRFEEPSEIQEKSIPSVIKGYDVLAESATGSGKTLAFASGIIQNANKGAGIQALILTPTRELADQVAQSFRTFSKYMPLRIVDIYGGVSIEPQIRALNTADIVIGTPGRMLDHIQRGTIKLSRVKTLVLDEADRMLDMGFVRDVEKIISACPVKRQTLLFSATISRDIFRLAKKYMHDIVEVSVESYVDPSKLSQVYYDVEDNFKFSLLVHLLKNEQPWAAMVFCNTQRNTDFVASNLKHSGINAVAIHGGLSQDKRTRIMKQFHSQKVNVLVCTDVAARGLDIKDVTHVYNYDIPKDPTSYIHRVGRTARAGNDGKAVNILASRDYDNFRRVSRDTSFKILRETTPRVERVKIRLVEKPKSGRGSPRGFSGGMGGFSRMNRGHSRGRSYR